MRILLTLLMVYFITILVTSQKSNMYRKILSFHDPDVADLIQELHDPLPGQLVSIEECAAYATAMKDSPIYKKKASAFKFVNGTCTLARTPPFSDKFIGKMPLSNEEEGYYIFENKPQSKVVHSDLLAYVLVNEQLAFNAHQNLPDPPDPTYYDGTTLRWKFDKESPVKTLEGYMAGTPIAPSELRFKLRNAKNLVGITISVWYNPGVPKLTGAQRIFSFDSPSGGYLFLQILQSGSISTRCKWPVGSPLALRSEDNSVSFDNWNYLTTTYDCLTGVNKIYVDGLEKTSDNHSAPGMIENMEDLLLGPKIESQPQGFTGYIASVEVYDRVLTAPEILEAKGKSTTYRVGM